MEIYLSPTAQKQFEAICEYLVQEWSVKTKNDFISGKTGQIDPPVPVEADPLIPEYCDPVIPV